MVTDERSWSATRGTGGGIICSSVSMLWSPPVGEAAVGRARTANDERSVADQ
jgi:hypothetical protein